VFDSLASRYARYAHLTVEKYTPWLHQVLPESVARAVDLGCGIGQCSDLLAQHADEVLAVDGSAAQLRLARTMNATSSVHFERRDIMEVTLGRDGLFGLVFSANALYRLYAHYDAAQVLTHLRALVAPGGSLVLIDMVLPADHAGLRHRLWAIQDAAARPLTRARYHQHATLLLPGVHITDTLDRHLIALHWRRPQQPATAGGTAAWTGGRQMIRTDPRHFPATAQGPSPTSPPPGDRAAVSPPLADQPAVEHPTAGHRTPPRSTAHAWG